MECGSLAAAFSPPKLASAPFLALVAPASSWLFVFRGSELQLVLSLEGLRHSAANKIPHLQRLPAPQGALQRVPFWVRFT